MAPAVPSTPHNRTAKVGPAPSLVSALRQDNKLLATELLRLDPTDLDTSTTAAAAADFERQQKQQQLGPDGQPLVKAPPVRFRQRLVFADDGLRNLFFRQILGDETAPGKKKKKKAQGPSSAGAPSPDDDLPIPRGLGIVGTRLLSHTNYVQGDGRAEDEIPLSDSVSRFLDLAGGGTQGGGGGRPDRSVSSAFAPHPAEDPRDETDGADVVVYLLRPDPLQTRAAARRLKRYAQLSSRGAVRHRIVFLPRGNALCDRILLDEGVLPLESVTVHSLPIDLIPLDADVLSLERADVLRRAVVEGLPSDPVTAVARSLVTLQDCAGTVGRVQALGPMAEAVLERSMSMRVDDYAAEDLGGGDVAAGGGGGRNLTATSVGPDQGGNSDPFASQVDAMMVIDRNIDMVTPMLTPLTYEGLLDEVLGIECGLVRVDANIIEPPEDSSPDERNATLANTTSSTASIALNDADTLYAEVRDQHVEKFGSFLQQQAQALKATHSDFTDKNRDLSEIHQFVKQIPIFTQNLRSLTHHILLAELVKSATEESTFRQRWQTERSMVESETCYDTLEDMISSQEPPFRVLRLLCLQSLTGGGIKSSRFESLRREVIQTYGFEFVVILNNLETAGLLRRKETVFALDSASPFATLRKHLRLINAEVNTTEPDDISYASSGYAPLTARLVEVAATIGWAGKDEALRELPGRLVDISQQHPPGDLTSAMKRNAGPSLGALARSKGGDAGAGGKKPVLLVYFVGGVTFMEIAALRLLSKRPSFPYSIICCTTTVLSGRSLLQSLS